MRDRTLLTCGALAGPVFIGTYTITGRVASEYDRRRDAVSTLARTDIGWTQTLNFFVSGLLTWAGAAGFRRALRSGTGAGALPVLVGAVAMGLIGAGLFATDTPEETAREGLSRRGALHVASAVPFFVGLPAACAVAAARFTQEEKSAAKVISANAGAVSITAATLAGAAFSRTEGRLFRWGGFFQRISVVTGFAWLTYVALLVRRQAG